MIQVSHKSIIGIVMLIAAAVIFSSTVFFFVENQSGSVDGLSSWQESDIITIDNLKYVVTSEPNGNDNGSVKIIGYENVTKLTIPLTIQYNEKTYTVNEVAEGAFYSFIETDDGFESSGFNGSLMIQTVYSLTGNETVNGGVVSLSNGVKIVDSFGTTYVYDSAKGWSVDCLGGRDIAIIPSEIELILENNSLQYTLYESTKTNVLVSKNLESDAEELFIGGAQLKITGSASEIFQDSDFISVYVTACLPNLSYSERSFMNSSNLKYAYFNGTTPISLEGVFYGCISLEYVELGSNVTGVESSSYDTEEYPCFGDCSSLTYICASNSIPDESSSTTFTILKSYDGYLAEVTAKYENGSLLSTDIELIVAPSGITSAVIPEEITSIGITAFESSTQLISLTLGSNVSSVEFSTFDNCSSLSVISVSANNTIYKSSLNMIVSYSGDYLYLCAKDTSTINVPDATRTIGDSAFVNSVLSTIYIPSKVSVINVGAFDCCYVLSSITVNQDNEKYISTNGMLIDKNDYSLIFVPYGVINVIIPSEVKIIGCGVFDDRQIKSISFEGESLTLSNSENMSNTGVCNDGDAVFYEMLELNKVSIICSGSLVIGNAAFYYCSNLGSVYLSGGNISIGKYAFAGSTASSIVCTITGDKGSISLDKYAFRNSTVSSLVFNGDVILKKASTAYQFIGTFDEIIFNGTISTSEAGPTKIFYGSSTTYASIGKICYNGDPTLSYDGASNTLVSQLYAAGSVVSSYAKLYLSIEYANEVNSSDASEELKELYAGIFKLNDDYTPSYADGEDLINNNPIFFQTDVEGVSMSNKKTSGDLFSFTLISDVGYTTYDLLVECNGIVVSPTSTGIYTVTVTSEMNIVVSECTGGQRIIISFDTQGGDIIKGFMTYSGRTILSSQLTTPVRSMSTFCGWYLDSKYTSMYILGTPIYSNTTLYAKWTTNENPTILYDTLYGSITASFSDGTIVSGSNVVSGSAVSFKFVPRDNYEFVSWRIECSDTDAYTKEDNVLSFNSITSDVTVSVNVRYYSNSNVLSSIVNVDSIESGEDVNLLWSYFDDEIDMSMSVWSTPSTPLIVGDFVYIYVGDHLNKIDVVTGDVVKTITIEKKDTYYRYLGYGNGYIIEYNTNSIYDLDLNKVCQLEKTIIASFYDSGYFYGLSENISSDYAYTLWKFSIDTNTVTYCTDTNSEWSDGIQVNWYNNGLGTTSAPVFEDDSIFFIETKNDSDYVGIASISIDTGKYNILELDKFSGMYLDDGWLTYSDGRLYLTCYAAALYESSANGDSLLATVAVTSNGFTDNSLIYVDLGHTGVTSQFIVFNGRGYVCVCTDKSIITSYVQVYDMSKLLASNKECIVSNIVSLVSEIKCVGTHGGIVLNTAYLNSDETRPGLVYIYLVPYNASSQAIYVITDYKNNTNLAISKTSYLPLSYGSQAVRLTEDGKLIWYSDTGGVYCYASVDDSPYYFFVKDFDEGIWISGTGSTPYEALLDAAENYGIDITFSQGIITEINDTSNTSAIKMWQMYKRDSEKWVIINSFTDSNDYTCHYFSIVFAGSISEDESWYYIDQDGTIAEYMFDSTVGYTDIIGIWLNVSQSNLSVKYDINMTGDVDGNKVIISLNIDEIIASNESPTVVVVYVEFDDSTFISTTVTITYSSGESSLFVDACGTSTPISIWAYLYDSIPSEDVSSILYASEKIMLTAEG